MKILIVVATEQEISPSLNMLEENTVDVLVTGVGMVATAYALGKRLQASAYDLIINVGIAGSFSRELSIGEVVDVVEDQLIELGAEDQDKFIGIEGLGFGQSIFSPTRTNAAAFKKLKKVSGITVNTVHGNADSIQKIERELENPTIESMEGAAVFFAAQEANIPAMQLRAISNYVEPRDKNKWNIPLAIKNLNVCLQEVISFFKSL